MFKKLRFLGIALVFVLAAALVACGSDDNNNNADNESNNTAENDAANNNGDASGDFELGQEDISIAFVAWAGEQARTPIVAKLLEKAGYNVEQSVLEAGPMWQAVADGNADLTTAAWLPDTHGDYWEQYGDDVDNFATFIDQAPLALTVPEYVEDVNTMEDLKDNEEFGDAVDWTITGIDPGAGIMQNTQKAIEEYGLDDWTLQESSESAMLSALMDAYDNEEPIIIPGWKPHQMFKEMDLKMLEDPKEVYGGEGDEINAVARDGLKEDAPAAYEIIKRFAEDYNTDMENDLLVKINVDGKDPETVADEFLEENQDLVDEWLDGIAE
ncbi:MAG TPA: glycine betaine ABC transporter substrate-binding protein [Bacillota bacterium]|nr:glycine betaine ABC transporter substrate-binding protein [Bacillota bacterium]